MKQGMMDDCGTELVVAHSRLLMKYATLESIHGDSSSLKLHECEKSTQSACQMIQFRCWNLNENIVEIFKFTTM
jgi:hypothetical protein